MCGPSGFLPAWTAGLLTLLDIDPFHGGKNRPKAHSGEMGQIKEGSYKAAVRRPLRLTRQRGMGTDSRLVRGDQPSTIVADCTDAFQRPLTYCGGCGKSFAVPETETSQLASLSCTPKECVLSSDGTIRSAGKRTVTVVPTPTLLCRSR